MANAPKTYERGKMDIRQNRETFELFWSLTKWNIVGIVVLLLVLAYLFT